jgi:hypothetical protein
MTHFILLLRIPRERVETRAPIKTGDRKGPTQPRGRKPCDPLRVYSNLIVDVRWNISNAHLVLHLRAGASRPGVLTGISAGAHSASGGVTEVRRILYSMPGTGVRPGLLACNEQRDAALSS